jgi:hypothetical protein
MANPNARVISGFQVDSFLVKEDVIKVVLFVNKEDLKVSDMGDIGDLLISLELHNSSQTPIELSLAKVNNG